MLLNMQKARLDSELNRLDSRMGRSRAEIEHRRKLHASQSISSRISRGNSRPPEGDNSSYSINNSNQRRILRALRPPRATSGRRINRCRPSPRPSATR